LSWLAAASAGRRDVAIVSDFQRGAITDAELARIPRAIGVRLIRAGRPAPSGETRSVDGWRGARWSPSLRIDGEGTAVNWLRGPISSPAVTLTIHAAPADAAAAARAEQAARSFGVPAADAVRPLEIWFAGASAPRGQISIFDFEIENRDLTPRHATPWVAAAAIALLRDPLPASAGAAIRVGEAHGAFVVHTDVTAASLAAPSVVRAALLAAAPPVADVELEPEAIDDVALARWRREPAPADDDGRPEGYDGRWLWGLALAGLAFEGVLRRRADRREPVEAHAHAA